MDGKIKCYLWVSYEFLSPHLQHVICQQSVRVMHHNMCTIMLLKYLFNNHVKLNIV